jgi:predicted transcriptional regulator
MEIIMCSILLSINPQHVENILNGTKRFEFRKRACKRKVDKLIIYSTYPIMKVVGEAEVEDVLIDEPEILWEKTQRLSGIDKNFFDKYYQGREQAVAYKLKAVKKYNMPMELSDFGVSSAPQSFVYVENI